MRARRHRLLVALGLAVCLLAGGGPAGAAEPLVDGAWLAGQIGNPRVVVLDLRPLADHVAGHIPGAVPADPAATEWTVATRSGAAAALPPVERIAGTIGRPGVGDTDHVVVAASAFPLATRVYWTFRVLGHGEVSILDGGPRSWAGPVEQGRAVRAPAAFTPRYDPSLRAELPMVAMAVAVGGRLVDARPMSQWSGAERSPAVRAPGRMPRAVSVWQGETLAADGRLKPREALERLFAPVGTGPAIVYCNTGFQAAVDWFVLSEILRRPGIRMYDGSMSEWTADPARPVAR